ncbi:VPLPA-CTERM sorting domain-containing protein [Roseovarius aestuariivivens]|uniref:VPLPA-CTERM sorting domain-containing protein n=1 Tax=Roseovarius aestuariivivens TaxID=1888910 RepID=UPI0010807033|nr:VPLPA-CTERM sorting domain-containing protein [Roseovarius aestuariivivens]
MAFDSTFPASGDPASTAAVSVDGVNFTVTATSARGTNGFRRPGDDAGLQFGLPGNGMNVITIVADQDVTFTSLTGEDLSLSNFTTPMQFNGTAGSLVAFTGIQFPSSLGIVDFTDFTLTSGDALIFAADYSARPGFSVIDATAVLSSLDFSKTVTGGPGAQIPLPAGLPLLLTGLGVLGLARRRKTA